MRNKLSLAAAAAALVGSSLVAQNQTVVFTGRFPSVAIDTASERPGGSASQIEGVDSAVFTPTVSTGARSLFPATAMQAYWGDAYNDNNYTRLERNVFTTYFERWDVAGMFIKDADRATAGPDSFYFTVRDRVVKNMMVLDQTGTSIVAIMPGDFVRFLPNGSIEYFVTDDLLAMAYGPVPAGQSGEMGASDICQDGAGNLYLSPSEGGIWVNGNMGGAEYCNRGAVVKIPASAITYDVSGNVSAIAPSSAYMLWNQFTAGPGGTAMWNFITGSNGQLNDGSPISASQANFYNLVGLDIDPNGGMATASYPDGSGNTDMVPNLVFCTDNGTVGGIIYSTANFGSVATINGVQMGSNTNGVPTDGSHLGVVLDTAAFQPTLMGLAVVPEIAPTVVLDMPASGSIQTTDPTVDFDMSGTPFDVGFVIADLGPQAPGLFFPSVPLGSFPVNFSGRSWPGLFPYLNPTTLGLVILNGNGYGTLSLPNFHNGTFTGATMVAQAVTLTRPFTVSSPVVLQLK